MLPEQIDAHIRFDRRGNPHVVRVMQHYHPPRPPAHAGWVKCERLRYVVDNRHVVVMDPKEADLLAVDGLGRLIRRW